MEGIRYWAMGLCAAAVGGAILMSLAPKNGLGKLLSVLISAFFLCLLLSPLTAISGNTELSLDITPTEIQDAMLTERINRQMHAQMEEAAASIVDTVLNAYGYAAEKVEIGTDISAEGYIYMDSVTVYVNNESAAHAVAIRTLLQQRFGVTVTVKEGSG